MVSHAYELEKDHIPLQKSYLNYSQDRRLNGCIHLSLHEQLFSNELAYGENLHGPENNPECYYPCTIGHILNYM